MPEDAPVQDMLVELLAVETSERTGLFSKTISFYRNFFPTSPGGDPHPLERIFPSLHPFRSYAKLVLRSPCFSRAPFITTKSQTRREAGTESRGPQREAEIPSRYKPMSIFAAVTSDHPPEVARLPK